MVSTLSNGWGAEEEGRTHNNHMPPNPRMAQQANRKRNQHPKPQLRSGSPIVRRDSRPVDGPASRSEYVQHVTLPGSLIDVWHLNIKRARSRYENLEDIVRCEKR